MLFFIITILQSALINNNVYLWVKVCMPMVASFDIYGALLMVSRGTYTLQYLNGLCILVNTCVS